MSVRARAMLQCWGSCDASRLLWQGEQLLRDNSSPDAQEGHMKNELPAVYLGAIADLTLMAAGGSI